MTIEKCLQQILQEPWVKPGYMSLVLRARMKDHGVDMSFKKAYEAVMKEKKSEHTNGSTIV